MPIQRRIERRRVLNHAKRVATPVRRAPALLTTRAMAADRNAPWATPFAQNLVTVADGNRSTLRFAQCLLANGRQAASHLSDTAQRLKHGCDLAVLGASISCACHVRK